MKKAKLLVMFLSVTLFSIGCSKDGGGGGSTKFSDNVPTGEIVAKELRNETLTGFSNSEGEPKNTNTQKWWEMHIQALTSSNCPEYDDSTDYEGDGYYVAFYPNGDLASKYGTDGTPDVYSSWEWSNSNKNSIDLEGTTFTITYLNDDNVVYASKQSGEGCTVETYEQFGSPYFD